MTLAQIINRMISKQIKSSTISSAAGTSPLLNKVIEIGEEENPDIESELREEGGGLLDSTDIKKQKEVDDTVEKVAVFSAGNVGDIQKMTTAQFSNIKQIALNPFGFIISAFGKKLVRGAGYAALVAIFIEIVRFVIDELMKPGRPLDRRFKVLADKQILVFMSRQRQQELRQGFKQVIVTTSIGLRGGLGKVNGNYYSPNNIPRNFVDERRTALVPNPKSQGHVGVGNTRGEGRFNR